MNAISIKNLNKKFGDFRAISDLSFEVKENRVMGFLGPNGAGKTTTLRILVGLSKPTSGGIEICGEKVQFGENKANHLFGYLPEQPSFYNWMTGREYLTFIAQTFEIKEKEKKINYLLKKVGLFEAKSRKIAAYSNGMKQRLGIAQALINDPKVLILDEPVSALDPIGRMEVLNIILELKKEVTILLSTHILSDVDKICDDIAIINRGKLVTVSSLSELKEKQAAPILEIEFTESPHKLISKLASLSWVGDIKELGNTLRILLKDEKVVNENIPIKFFSTSEIGVLRYGLTLPEVEDLFVTLIEEEVK